MKSKAAKIVLLYSVVAILFAFFSLKYLQGISTPEHFVISHTIRDVFLILFSAIILHFYIRTNEGNNNRRYDSLEKSTKEIQASKERYDLVAKATSDTIWDWDITTNDFSWSRGIEEVFGYDRLTVARNAEWWFERIHPKDKIKMSVKLYAFLEQKTQKWQDEYRFRCADGSYKYVLDRGFLQFGEDGKPSRMIGALQDVTRSKQEERRLKLLEMVITNNKDAVVIADAGTAELAMPRIIFVNEAFTQMTGYEASEAIGLSPLFFFGEKSNPSEISKISSCIRQKCECEIETIAYRKDGSEYWLRFPMVPVFNSENEHTHWISVQRDVSERKKQEKEKEQLINELTQNNKDLRQFSYITSHNLRAPLSNLMGLLKVVEEIKIDNDELKMILEGFSKSTFHLNETISDLSKVVIIRDKPSIEKQYLHIGESLGNVMAQIENLIAATQAKIHIDVDGVDKIYTNKTYFESILLNLLTNALKYRDKERELEINIVFSETEDDILLHFDDNGIGIDLEKYGHKVFGLYQRFHNHPDSKGLGLYLVKSQIESMGGSIHIESEVGKGTRFTIKFNKEP